MTPMGITIFIFYFREIKALQEIEDNPYVSRVGAK